MAQESDPLAERRIKLPFWKTVGRSYSAFFNNIGSALRVTWLWLLLVGTVAAITGYVQFGVFQTFLADPHSMVATLAFPSQLAVLSLLMEALMLVGGASSAVMWHRFLLLREMPALSGSNVVSPILWRYIGTAILIYLTVALMALPFFAGTAYVAAQEKGHTNNPVLVVAVIGLFVVWVCLLLGVMRLLPLLPARAIGNSAITFRQMWATTTGNAWRIFGGCMLTLIPPLAVLQVLFGHSLLSKFAPVPGQPLRLPDNAMAEIIAFQTAGAVYSIFAGLIMIGFLSFSYQHFIGSSSPPEAAAS